MSGTALATRRLVAPAEIDREEGESARMDSAPVEVSRYAPSTTGPAHPGTLLAALLCWLDARSRGARLVLRLEDLDPDRCKPEYGRNMIRDLEWLGPDWDSLVEQRHGADTHARALDHLAEAGLLYPCRCTRAEIRASSPRSPDGGFRYLNRCRTRALPSLRRGGWRASDEPLRVRLPEGLLTPVDEGGLDLAQDPTLAFGDPIVRRRDGAVAYHLASVVDDATSGVTRIVRGRDLAASSATQVALRLLLDLPIPRYRHHFLLLERSGQKLAKLHGSVGVGELRQIYGSSQLCGVLAHGAGLLPRAQATTPRALLAEFSWARVRREDRLALWTGAELEMSDVAVPRS